MTMSQMRTLLIVDDEVDMLELLVEEVQSWGIKVHSAASIKEAMEIFRTEPIAAILSDISMPGGTGIDLLECVRGMGRDTPFLFLTAYDKKEFLLQAMKLGAIDFLEKPYNNQQLQDAVFKALEIGVRLAAVENSIYLMAAPESIAKQQKYINLLRIQHAKRDRKKNVS
ncbi:MAG: hypothetical protein COT73_00700 [Bdellovibrio sp. CG10_big_fil_rev_8_21_14_0_10_47_8]|nr:MAG: hypothetical protein COT73_00700 [Bdellovibrio sp. CG10_big_fil_rev_8_21_14_0_10_47_8]